MNIKKAAGVTIAAVLSASMMFGCEATGDVHDSADVSQDVRLMMPAACLRCEHRDDWTGCRDGCVNAKQRLAHELRKISLEIIEKAGGQDAVDRARARRDAGV